MFIQSLFGYIPFTNIIFALVFKY